MFLTIAVSIFGRKTVIFLQKLFATIFGILTLIVITYVLLHAKWDEIYQIKTSNWITNFIPAVTIIAAGTGISWAIAGADYSRYQKEANSNKGILFAVVSGAFIPLSALTFTGIIIAEQLPGLATSSNPIEMIGAILPSWLFIPYLITEVGALISIAVLSLYSASLNLMTLGVKTKQVYAVILNSIIIILPITYILFISNNFLTAFSSFLVLCGIFLASWEAIFITNYFLYRRKISYKEEEIYANKRWKNQNYNSIALISWISGSVIGLSVTDIGFFHGVLAKGLLKESSFGIILAFFISGILYSILYIIFNKKLLFEN